MIGRSRNRLDWAVFAGEGGRVAEESREGEGGDAVVTAGGRDWQE